VIKNDTSVERLRDYMRDLKEGTASPTSDQWSVWISQCRRWGVEPFETYRGELEILYSTLLRLAGTDCSRLNF